MWLMWWSVPWQGRASALLQGMQLGELAAAMVEAGRQREVAGAMVQLVPAAAALGGAFFRCSARIPHTGRQDLEL